MPFFLWNWLRRRGRPSLGRLHVVMYTRQGCHLCEDAWEILRAEQAQHGFQLEAIDIDGSPELVERYGEWVPVVTVDSQVRFKGGLNPVLLRRLLRGEGGKSGEW